MRRTPGTTTAEAMQGVFGGMEGGGRLRENLALAYWDRVVGPQAAAASEADSILNGVLVVRTRSSVWSHELTFMQDHIKTELNRLIGRSVIQRIVFKAQGVSRSPEEAVSDLPSEEDLELVILTSEEKDALDNELLGLRAIDDSRIIAIVSRRLVRERRLYRWRIEHGWSVCASCGTLHLQKTEICPMCNLGL